MNLNRSLIIENLTAFPSRELRVYPAMNPGKWWAEVWEANRDGVRAAGGNPCIAIGLGDTPDAAMADLEYEYERRAEMHRSNARMAAEKSAMWERVRKARCARPVRD